MMRVATACCWRSSSPVHTGRLAYPEDIRAVAKAMQVEEAEIAALKPLEWIEKNMQTGQVSRGVIAF